MRYWRIGNLRLEGLGATNCERNVGRLKAYHLPLGFLGVALESTVLGKALLVSVENESMMIRLAFSGGKFWVG
jgi:hypothetical protein